MSQESGPQDLPPEPRPCREPSAQGSPNPIIPGYQIDSWLGGGGMGDVYKAIDLTLKRPVAIKVIKKGCFHLANLDRFKREAEAAASVIHANVVTVHTGGEYADGGTQLPYLVMEYVEGHTLKDRLASGPLEPAQAAQLVETLAKAMEYVHQHKMVHRDLKPGNILLPGKKEVRLLPEKAKIADFGLAKCLDSDKGQTRSGAIVGTPAYMAPEQIGKNTSVDFRTDVYGLGAVLYHCLTGEAPFEELSRTKKPIRPSKRRPGIPPAIDKICMRCLERDPRKRYQTAAEVATALRGFVSAASTALTNPKPLPRAPRQQSTRRVLRRPTNLLLFLGCLALFLFLSALLALSPGGRSPVGLGVLGIMFLVILYSVYQLFFSPQPPTPETVFLLRAVLLAFVILLFAAVLSLVTGWPPALREFFHPSVIPRKNYPSGRINLPKPVEAHKVFNAKTEELEGRFRGRMGIWKDWLREGAKGGLLVYETPSFDDYYNSFDARLVFDRVKVKLLDGAAFLKRVDQEQHEEVYRQLDFYVRHDNGQIKANPGKDPTDNALKKVKINSGETLLVVVQIAALDGSPLLCNLELYQAHLALDER